MPCLRLLAAWTALIVLVGCSGSETSSAPTETQGGISVPVGPTPHLAQAPESSERLRVVSLNVWAVPYITPVRHERLQALAPELAKLSPNVVLLQELWSEEDASSVARSLAGIGLTHEVHVGSSQFAAYGSAGLMIAADRPLAEVQRLDYELGRWPHTPYHLDWLSRKAALSAVLQTRAGALRLINTHWQANYRSGDYEPVRLGQALELAHWLRAEPRAAVIAGDFNSLPSESAPQLLAEAAGLTDVAGGEEIDRAYVRPGRSLSAQLLSWRHALSEPVELPSGRTPLSDHLALVVDLSLAGRAVLPLAPPGREVQAGPSDAIAKIHAEPNSGGPAHVSARSQLANEQTKTRRQIWAARTTALISLLLALLLSGGVGKRRFALARRWPRRGAFTLLALSFTYASYFGWLYGPEHARGIERAMQRTVDTR